MWRVLAAVLLASVLAPAQSGRGSQVITVEVERVNIHFTVANTKGRIIPDLGQERFRVFEDGRPQTITNFSREADLPLTLVLVMDTSGSIRDKLAFEKEAAIHFLHATLRPNRDKAALLTFDTVLELKQDFTEDPGVLAQAVGKIRAGGGTRLYDAVHLILSEKLTGPEERKAIILITDGEDNSSKHSPEEVVELAQRNNVSIYAISTNRIGAQWPGSNRSDGIIGMLSVETGGRAFFPTKPEKLAAHFTRLSDELRSQYSIAYRSTNPLKDGSYRKIQIEVANSKHSVRARSGYYAPLEIASTED